MVWQDLDQCRSRDCTKGPTTDVGAFLGAPLRSIRRLLSKTILSSSASGPVSYFPLPCINASSTEQEYDAAVDMMDEAGDTPDTPSGPGPYPGPTYAGEPQPMSLSSPVTTGPPPGSQQLAAHSPAQSVAHGQQPTYPSSMTQLLDPSYDFDPFGLSASMAFPTQFSFDTSNMR